ncbi:Hemicentin-1, partial [Cricetulus griseus]
GGRILQLSLVQAEDAGRYSCKASNEVGEDWLHYELLVLSTHTLRLARVQPADSGTYLCEALNAAGRDQKTVQLDVLVAPTIQPGPNVVDIPVNRTALLPCQAHGVPTPLMSWRKDGIPLDPGSPRLEFLPEGSLRIDPVLEQDAGHYLCVASNSAGSDRQGLDLRVLEPPTIAPGPSNLTLTAHSPASLPCEAKGSPKPLVSWWKDGQKLDFRLQQDAYRLLPSNALLLAAPSPQDSAQFECVVSNEVGESRRRYQVTVHGALEIEQALPIHAGRYTCTARNSAGMARKHMVLIVQASPVVKPLPSVVQAVESEEVLLPCEASGIPQPVVIWQKEGLSIPEGELLTMTQMARGLDPDGLLLLEVTINGMIPESLADADLHMQDFQENYVQTGPGQLFVGSTQHFLHDSLPASLRCNHSIQYDKARGPQPQLVQHLRASSISSTFDPEAEALRFQLTTALQADRNECSAGPSPCSHTCRNAPGHFSCSCPTGFTLARDHRNCRDVDECLEQLDECHYNQLCENTAGSHHCSCPRGYRQQGHGLPCLGKGTASPSLGPVCHSALAQDK